MVVINISINQTRKKVVDKSAGFVTLSLIFADYSAGCRSNMTLPVPNKVGMPDPELNLCYHFLKNFPLRAGGIPAI